MAYSDQKASLPPIIEDESDDNSMPMLYRKELGRDVSRNEERATSFPESHSNRNNVPTTVSPQIPYNSWRSKNAAYLRSPDGEKEDSNMVSKLGQSLESCHVMLPRQSKHSSFASSPVYQQDFHQQQGNPQFQTQPLPPNSIQFEENSRFMNSTIGIHDSRNFSSPYDPTNRGYFPKQSNSYVEPSYTSQNPLRNLSSDLQNHDSYKFSPNSERPFHCSNMPTTPLGHHSVPVSSYKLHQGSPNHFQGQMLLTGPPGPADCQGSCCRNSHLSTSNDLQNYQSVNSHTPHRGSSYRHEVILPSHKAPSCMCHENSSAKNKRKENKNEKSREKQITDLYRIVWLQNQQIMDLQNQVKKLIELHEKSDEKSKKQDCDHASKILSKGEKRMFNLSVIEENQNLMEKVSVGIMTSFIDTTSVKGKKQNKKIKNKSRKVSKSSTDSSNSTTSESSSQSSGEELSPETNKKSKWKQKRGTDRQEDSMILNGLEIQTVAETPPSPTSLHIELQDFASSSQDSDSSETDEEKPVPVSWTFYDKVVGKVNNILKDSESEDEEDDDNDSESEHTTHKKTLEQLRKFGPQFVDSECSPTSKRVTFTGAYPIKPLAESDTSMKMNALAVKYLKEERLSNGREESNKIDNGGTSNNNLSYATLRYLERNHLVSKSPVQTHENTDKVIKTKKKKEKRTEEKTSKKRKSKSSQLSGKILDITAIKQQPKLLPKKHC